MIAARVFALALALLALCNSPAGAFDLFATHEISVQFATSAGQPMAEADVKVFAPGDLNHPVRTGKTDKNGKFSFGADRDGLWTAQAEGNGEVARATIRVGGGANEAQQRDVPIIVIGGLLVLLVLAVWYRFLRARARGR